MKGLDKMNFKLRLLSIASALAVLLSSAFTMAGCNDDETNETTTSATTESATESETEVLPDVERKNYEKEFYLHILPDVNPFQFYWAEESKGDILSDAIYTRQERVRQYLGVDVIGTETGIYNEYIEPFKIAVKNKDESVHTLICHVYGGVSGLISENYLTDLNEMPGIDLEADYWNQQFMEDLSLNGRNYLGFSDFNLLYTHVVAFNKTMLEQYEENLNESVYDMVTNYHWTVDKMISLANLAYIDKTGDGKTKDDTFGIASSRWVPFCALLQSSNINHVEIDESGKYVVAPYLEKNRERTTVLVEKLKALVASNAGWFWDDRSGNDISFTGGNSLMTLVSTYILTSYAEKDIVFGVLPYPMFDEAQKDVGYRSLQWGGYICVPTYLGNNTVMVGETLEMLSFYSDDVIEVFYQKLLGKQVAESPQDKQMLDIIWDSVCSDFGQTFCEVTPANTLHLLSYLTAENASQNLASYMAERERTANNAYTKFLKKFR